MDNNLKLSNIVRKAVFAFLFLLVIIAIPACNNSQDNKFAVIEGKSLSILFDKDFNYSGDDFFYIDNFLVSHTLGVETQSVKPDTIEIFPRNLVFFTDSVAGTKSESIENIHIALTLYEGLLQQNKKYPEKNQYICISPSLLSITGELQIRNESGEQIVIKVPANYPVTIEKLK